MLPATTSWTTVFSDDFNRADSLTVGNGWGEVEPPGSPAPSASISGSVLLMVGGDTGSVAPNPTPAAVVRSQSLSGDFRVTFTFGFPGSLSWVNLYVTTSGMKWYAMGFQPGFLGIWKDNVALPGSVSPALVPARAYSLDVRREGADITVVLTDTTTSQQWVSAATDESYHDFTAVHLKAGYYVTGATSVTIDNFVLQTR